MLSLDLLGLFIASVYSSVFIALALLALQFGPFWSLSTSTEAASMRSSVSRMFIPMTLMVVVGCVGFSNQVVGYADWESFLLWQDLVSIDDSSLFSQC